MATAPLIRSVSVSSALGRSVSPSQKTGLFTPAFRQVSANSAGLMPCGSLEMRL
jgi:hypothetical protein